MTTRTDRATMEALRRAAEAAIDPEWLEKKTVRRRSRAALAVVGLIRDVHHNFIAVGIARIICDWGFKIDESGASERDHVDAYLYRTRRAPILTCAVGE